MTDTAAPPGEHSLLSGLIAGAPVGIALLDHEYRYLLINESLAELNGVPRADHLGRSVAEVLPHLWPKLQPYYDRVLEGEVIPEVWLSGRVGSASEERFWKAGYYPVRDAEQRVVGIGVVCVETTDRVRARREVKAQAERERGALEQTRKSEQDLRAILTAMPDLIFNLSRDGTHLSFHAPHMDGLYAPPATFLGKRVREVLPADVAQQFEEAIARTLATQAMQTFEYRLDFPETGRHMFDARMVPKGSEEVVVIVRDMTDVRALEDQLRQSQKMEAIGRLAGGVAHDFNNLLTVINGYADLLATRLTDAPELELLNEIRQSGERAAGLTRQLLLFSRRQFAEPRVLDLNEVVTGSQGMIQRLITEDVIVATDLAPDLPRIRADHGQLEQLLLNLVVNARDAMPDGGRLTIASRPQLTRSGAKAPLREYVELSVTDSGVGIESEIRERIFEPFFTTKPPGKGTGLGLSVVFGVVKSCDGFIKVDSAPGRGSTFRLYFPVVQDSGTEPAPSPEQDTLPSGDETILLVEDEERVRALGARVLRDCGYRLLEAADGRQALQIARASAEPIHLAIIDVVMPFIGGRELARRLMEIRPDTAVLFVSGYTDDEVLRRGVSADVFLQKPFTPTALAHRVRAVLDRHAAR